MFRIRRLPVPAVAAVVTMLAVAHAAAQLKNPSDWAWRLDAPATLVTSLDVPESSWLFVMMPPGWHVTTGPGALLYPSRFPEVIGNFSVETQIFLFPGESLEEYGVYIGGRNIAGQAPADYTAFVLRRDGQAAVLARSGDTPRSLAPWRAHQAVVAHTGGTEPVKNSLRVDVDPVNVTLSVNGAKVLDLPTSGVGTTGSVGFRVGKALNLHITSLDVTQRLAPVPVRR